MISSIQFKLDHLFSILPRIRKTFNQLAVKDLVEIIKKQIQSGISPVRGVARFVRYSDVYNHAIRSGAYRQFSKFPRPVNLTLSGMMLSKMQAAVGGEVIKLSIRHKLANVHNEEGAGKSKVIRRLLPTKKGEEFSRPIAAYVLAAAKKAVHAEIIRHGSGGFTKHVPRVKA